MNTHEEKIALLSEMVSFSLVDGELHDNELKLLTFIRKELGIKKSDFIPLFSSETTKPVIKDDFSRMLHFYQLVLIMHCDNRLHFKENIAINKIGLRMGINPLSMKLILELIIKSPNKKVSMNTLLEIHKSQFN